MGYNWLGVQCLNHLLTQGENIIGLIPSSVQEANWYPDIRKLAQSHNLSIYEFTQINSEENVNFIKTLNADLAISILFNQIFKKNFINIFPLGVINLHLALLPKNRGCYTTSWNILNNEKYAGASLHFIDEGIDTGDIISQYKIKIEETDTAFKLYNKVIRIAYQLFIDTYPAIKGGYFSRIPQCDNIASYHSNKSIDFKDRIIDWSKNPDEVLRWVKARIFDPIQFPILNINTYEFRVTFIKYLGLKKDKTPLIVKTGNDTILYRTSMGVYELTLLFDDINKLGQI